MTTGRVRLSLSVQVALRPLPPVPPIIHPKGPLSLAHSAPKKRGAYSSACLWWLTFEFQNMVYEWKVSNAHNFLNSAGREIPPDDSPGMTAGRWTRIMSPK